MFRLILPLAALLASSQATPCNEAPSSALATFSSVGGWIPETGDTIFDVDQALGIQDIYVIPSLNQDISNPNNIIVGSTYCVPYITPVTSAYWSNSGTFPWLYLVQPTSLATPTSALTVCTNTLTSTTGSVSTSTTSASMSTASASTSTISASTSTTSASTSSTSASTSTISASTSTTSAFTSTTSASTSSTSASTSTSSTSASTISTSRSPTSSLLCGGNPAFSEMPTVDNGAKGDLGQCYIYCQLDASCMAFGYVAAVGDCFLYDSAIYYPAQASGTSGIYYWNLDCFTTTSSISTPTGSV